MPRPRHLLLGCLLLMILSPASTPAALVAGLARRDITPGYPIRLTGYAARTNLSAGVAQTLWAKALVLGSDAEGPRVLVTVDNCGVPAGVVEAVAEELRASAGVERSRFTVASSHTHAGPMVRGFAENIFVRDLTPEEAAASDRYTAELRGHLVAVVQDALRARAPARLEWNSGTVGFAANRRTPGGPVDHALPVLMVRDPDGRLRGVVANYACHCTTLGHQINRHHGDWAGFAQEFLEAAHPGCTAMITIGCGADANPSPRGGDDFGVGWARTHAQALAQEVGVLVQAKGRALEGLPRTAIRSIRLPFEPLPSRKVWEQRAAEFGIVGYHARKNLARLDRGESLPTGVDYPVQAWDWPGTLTMVFLGGEVVVDYVLRLKAEDPSRHWWVTAYANDVPGYIPSRRILQEGGYEAETSLWYYDRPARFSPEIEETIHREVRVLVRTSAAP